MSKAVADVMSAKAKKEALGNAVRSWIANSRNVKSIKVKFGDNGKEEKPKKKRSVPKTPRG